MLKSSKKGFTLSELLLAAAILAFVLSVLLSIFVNCILLNNANKNLTIATGHAQFAMEALKNTNFTSIQSQTWDSAAITSKGLTPLNTESIVITVTGTDPLTIQVTVNWKDRGVRDRSINLSTIITEP